MKVWRWDIVLGVVVLIDVLRVFLPSLITLFGQAGGTPPEHMGLFALVWFLVPLAVPLAARVIPVRGAIVTTGLGLIAARVVLQTSSGGDLQLYAAAAGVALGLSWFTAVAMRTVDTAATMRAFLSGLGIAMVMHAVLAEVDLVWRAPQVAVPLLILELGGFGYFLLRSSGGDEIHRSPIPLLACGPILLLWGMYLGNPAHMYRGAGLLATALLAAATAAWIFSLAGPAPGRGIRAVAGAVLVGSATFFTVDGLDTATWGGIPSLPIVTILALAATTVLLREPASLTTARSATGRGWAVATSLLGFLVLTFAYYAAFDVGYPNQWVPPLAAVLVTVVGLAGGRGPQVTPMPRSWWPMVPAVTGAFALTMIAPLWQSMSAPSAPPSDGLRIAAYNIRMGFDLSGRLALDRQADALASLDPHVIALSEVDRGWLLNGGHDNLRRLADRLGMGMIWAPADGNQWGDAVLTNLPVDDVTRHGLVDAGPTGAQALEVTIRWQGSPITVIATHLQPPPDWEPLDQVEQLADIAAAAAADTPVIVAGDLNLEPDTPAWDVLTAVGLTDPFDRPFPTIPGSSTQQIDHILLTEDFTARGAANPDLPYSDHRPIAVTVELIAAAR